MESTVRIIRGREKEETHGLLCEKLVA
jgi:hypothetical protein